MTAIAVELHRPTTCGGHQPSVSFGQQRLFRAHHGPARWPLPGGTALALVVGLSSMRIVELDLNGQDGRLLDATVTFTPEGLPKLALAPASTWP